MSTVCRGSITWCGLSWNASSETLDSRTAAGPQSCEVPKPWRSWRAAASARTRSSHPSAPGAWGKSTGPATPASGARSPSRSSRADAAADPERLRRFQREARAVAALNHPHILAVYDIGSDAGVDYVVFELLEGQTLRRRLEPGPLPARKVVDYGVQICRGLAAAHERGVVHRDLKPENLFLTAGGQVKILDFGLAKLSEPADRGRSARGADESTAVTAGGPRSGDGRLHVPGAGRGQRADARSDLFALGAILYEMLSGRRAFRGDTAADTLARSCAAIRPRSRRSGVPPGLERVVRRCLEKRPRASASRAPGTSAFALETLTGPSGSEVVPPPRTRRRWLKWAALLAAVAGAILVAVWIKGPRGSPPIGPITPVTSDAAQKQDVAFSPDGKQLAFTRVGEEWPPDLYVKLIGGAEPILITHRAFTPAWSPDGREIAFIRHVEKTGGGEEDAVFGIPALGGPERQLATLGQVEHGLSYSPDGKLLAMANQERAEERPGIFLLSLETGEKRRLTRPSPGTIVGDSRPRFSPDGRTLAFVRAREGFDDDVYVVPVEGGEPRRVTRGCLLVVDFDWAPDGRSLILIPGHVLRVATTTLFRAPVAGGELQALGVGEDPYAMAVSRQGNRLAYVRSHGTRIIWRLARPAAREKQKPPVRILASDWDDWNGPYSPDGRLIAFTSFRSGNSEIWVSDGDGSNPRQITFLDGLYTGTASWSPEGRELCFSSNNPGNGDIYVIPAVGGIPRQLTTDPSNEWFCSWSRDGQWVYFDSSRSGRREVWKVHARGGTATQVTRSGGVFAQEAPDGRSLFFTKANLFEPGPPPGLWRMPAEGGQEAQVLPNVASDGFSVVGRGIYHLNRNAQPGPAIEFYDFATDRVSRIAVLAIEGHLHSFGFAVSPDERNFLYTVWPKPKCDIVLVENFR